LSMTSQRGKQMETTKLKILNEGTQVYLEIENLGVAVKREGKSWTIFCPSLKVLGYSNKSEKDAYKDFEENLSLFFTVHIHDNTLNSALLDFRWNKKELSLTQTLRAKIESKKVSPKIEFSNKNTSVLNTRDFKVPVHAYA